MKEKIVMPDGIVQGYQDNESMHGCQSVWMAHWMSTSNKSATQAPNHLSIDCESKREVKEDSNAEQHNVIGGQDVVMNISTKATKVTFVNKSLMENPGKLKKDILDCKLFSIHNLSQKRDGILSLKREQYGIYHGEVLKSETDDGSGDNNVSLIRTGSHLPSTSARVPPKSETLSRECHLLSGGFLPADLLTKSPDAIEKNNLAVSTSLWNDFVKPTFDIVPYRNNRGKTSIPSFTCKQHEIYKSNYNLASREHFTSTNYHSYSSLLIREKKMSSLLDPHRSWFSRLMQSDPAHLPYDPLASSSDDALDFFRAQHQMMQKYIGTAKFSSQTGPLESTKPEIFYRGSSSVSQLPCSVNEVETMKIYSTIDSGEESSRGDVRLPSNKWPKDCQNSSRSQVAITSAREKTKAKMMYTAVPGINQELPELHILTSSLDDRETITSRTQGLDVYHLLTHAEDHANSKSSSCGNGSLGPELSSRWVKRLKLCTSDYAHGTKSEKIEGTSSHEKLNNIFMKVIKGCKTNSEPKMICLAEKQKVPDLPATISPIGKPSSVKAKQTVEITLSHPWIQRWSHDRAVSSPKRKESVKLREPQSSNTIVKEFQKEFPSIAALALMGKAISSLDPCVVMKKGPLVVWNMKGF